LKATSGKRLVDNPALIRQHDGRIKDENDCDRKK